MKNIDKKSVKFQIYLQNLLFRYLVTTQIRRTSLHLKKNKKFNDSTTILQQFCSDFNGFSAFFGNIEAIYDDIAVISSNILAIF